jgi:hypothetical protein
MLAQHAGMKVQQQLVLYGHFLGILFESTFVVAFSTTRVVPWRQTLAHLDAVKKGQSRTMLSLTINSFVPHFIN